jgi:hypothetical protein
MRLIGHSKEIGYTNCRISKGQRKDESIENFFMSGWLNTNPQRQDIWIQDTQRTSVRLSQNNQYVYVKDTHTLLTTREKMSSHM